MAIVVSDTSPIRALYHLNLLSLVGRLYGDLILPVAVDTELRTPLKHFPSIDLASSGEAAIRSASPASIARISKHRLDPGETEAIALAIEINADYLLMDERAGRRAADNLRIKYVGVFGVLIEAKRQGLLTHIAPLTARLRKELRFHIQPEFERTILATINETPEA